MRVEQYVEQYVEQWGGHRMCQDHKLNEWMDATLIGTVHDHLTLNNCRVVVTQDEEWK